jgi:hypothetical protein
MPALLRFTCKFLFAVDASNFEIAHFALLLFALPILLERCKHPLCSFLRLTDIVTVQTVAPPKARSSWRRVEIHKKIVRNKIVVLYIEILPSGLCLSFVVRFGTAASLQDIGFQVS